MRGTCARNRTTLPTEARELKTAAAVAVEEEASDDIALTGETTGSDPTSIRAKCKSLGKSVHYSTV